MFWKDFELNEANKKLIEEMADQLIDCSGWAWVYASNFSSAKAKKCAEDSRNLALKARGLLRQQVGEQDAR